MQPESVIAKQSPVLPVKPRASVVDSGYRSSENDPRVSVGVSFFGGAGRAGLLERSDDENGHGTSVVETILDTCPSAVVTPLKVFGSTLETSVGPVLEAMDWSLREDVDVVNLSLATDLQSAQLPLYAMCERLQNAGITVVASANNRTGRGFPAEFANVFGVAIQWDEQIRPPRLEHDREVEFWVSRGSYGPRQRDGSARRLTTSSLAAAFVTGLILQIVKREGRLPLPDLRQAVLVESTSRLPGNDTSE